MFGEINCLSRINLNVSVMKLSKLYCLKLIWTWIKFHFPFKSPIIKYARVRVLTDPYSSV